MNPKINYLLSTTLLHLVLVGLLILIIIGASQKTTIKETKCYDRYGSEIMNVTCQENTPDTTFGKLTYTARPLLVLGFFAISIIMVFVYLDFGFKGMWNYEEHMRQMEEAKKEDEEDE